MCKQIRPSGGGGVAGRVPATSYFLVSAVFHYLAPPWRYCSSPGRGKAEQILAAVATGIGISVLDRHRATKLCPAGVLVRRFAAPRPHTELALIWPSTHQSAVLRSFIRTCQQGRPISASPAAADSATPAANRGSQIK